MHCHTALHYQQWALLVELSRRIVSAYDLNVTKNTVNQKKVRGLRIPSHLEAIACEFWTYRCCVVCCWCSDTSCVVLCATIGRGSRLKPWVGWNLLFTPNPHCFRPKPVTALCLKTTENSFKFVSPLVAIDSGVHFKPNINFYKTL